MHTHHTPYFLRSLIALIFPWISLLASTQIPDLKRWEDRLEKSVDGKKTAMESLWDSIRILPPSQQAQIIYALEKSNIGKNNPIKILLLKGKFSRRNDTNFDNKNWIYWGNEAIKQAVATNNPYLLEDACGLLGDGYLWANQTDTALFYLLKALEIGETLGYNPLVIARRKVEASNGLYQTQNYQECIAFCKAGIPFEAKLDCISGISMFNNLGLSFLKTGQTPSAIKYFKEAVRIANACKSGVWVGIASGNVGDALHEAGDSEAAIPYWQTDVDSCLAYNEWPNAGLSLAYIAHFQFAQGKRKEAIEKMQWAHSVNANDPVNLVRILALQANIYRMMQLHDSADYFWAQHYALSDSLQRKIAKGNYNTIQLKLQYERNEQQYLILQKEKIALENRRNMMAVALLSLLVIAVLVYNRQRLQIKLEKRSKAFAEATALHAKQELENFTLLIIEKNAQITLLTEDLSKIQTANHEELVHKTLLTDYDWNRFKELFEKSFPGFFETLKSKSPGITASEMRLAALIKLNLDNKQMASMQGISVSSVRGNKTRLRQKLDAPPETDLEDFIRAL